MGQEEIIARRYASGLAERAAETGETERVRADVRLLAEMVNPRSWKYVAALADMFASPQYAAKEKMAAAAAVLDRLGVCGTSGNFFSLLAERGRTALLPRIAAHFDAIAGGCGGVVETARPLPADQMDRLRAALSAAFGCPVRLEQRLDPELIAGARVTVGGKIIDNSVLGTWRRLRDRLASGAPGDDAKED